MTSLRIPYQRASTCKLATMAVNFGFQQQFMYDLPPEQRLEYLQRRQLQSAKETREIHVARQHAFQDHVPSFNSVCAGQPC